MEMGVRVCARMHTQSLSRVPLFATPWTIAHQALLSPGLSRQEYWSSLPFPIPGDLPRDQTSVSCTSCFGRQVLCHWCHLGSPEEMGDLCLQNFKLLEGSQQAIFKDKVREGLRWFFQTSQCRNPLFLELSTQVMSQYSWNHQYDKSYSLFCNFFFSIWVEKCYILKGQSLENGLLCISGYSQLS